MSSYASHFFVLVVVTALLGISSIFIGDAQAGGCCFKRFSAQAGVANKQDALLSVAFVDPQKRLECSLRQQVCCE